MWTLRWGVELVRTLDRDRGGLILIAAAVSKDILTNYRSWKGELLWCLVILFKKLLQETQLSPVIQVIKIPQEVLVIASFNGRFICASRLEYILLRYRHTLLNQRLLFLNNLRCRRQLLLLLIML